MQKLGPDVSVVKSNKTFSGKEVLNKVKTTAVACWLKPVMEVATMQLKHRKSLKAN